eukprot:jgi/Psemu1/611/gm1.611_g
MTRSTTELHALAHSCDEDRIFIIGLNQDELKGLVVDGSKVQQYDKLFEGLKEEMRAENYFLSEQPNKTKEEYTNKVKGNDGNEMEVIYAIKQQMLSNLWAEKAKWSTKKYDHFIEDLKNFFSAIEGQQLAPNIRQQLKSDKNWKTIEMEHSTIQLLTILREYCYSDGSTMTHPMLDALQAAGHQQRRCNDTTQLLTILREYCYRDGSTMTHPILDAINKVSQFLSCKKDINNDTATYVDETKARHDVLNKSVGIRIILEEMIRHTLTTKLHQTATYAMYKKLETDAKKVILDETEEFLLAIATPMALEQMYQYKARKPSNPRNNVTNQTGENHNNSGNNTSGNNPGGKDKERTTTDGTSLTTKGVKTEVEYSHQMLMADIEEGHFDDEFYFVQTTTCMSAPHSPPSSNDLGPDPNELFSDDEPFDKGIQQPVTHPKITCSKNRSVENRSVDNRSVDSVSAPINGATTHCQPNQTGNTYWYVDATFAVHADMKSHTSGLLIFGQGAVVFMPTKQKLNILMRLEMNGKSSSTKRTRHINIHNFLITDCVKNGEITIEYCPTSNMIADFFTKPLQGGLFRKFQNTIMGITDAEYLQYCQEYYATQRAKDSLGL